MRDWSLPALACGQTRGAVPSLTVRLMVSRGDGKAEAEVAHRGLGVGDVSEAVMLASGLWARKQSAFQIGSLGLSMTVLHSSEPCERSCRGRRQADQAGL
jgi:hypothetical protein